MSFSDEDKKVLAKLRTAIAIHKVEVLENPLPYLKEAEKRICQLILVLDKIDFALSDWGADLWIDENSTLGLNDFHHKDYTKVQNARKIIREYRNG